MKFLFSALLLSTMTLATFAQETDPVKKANASNEKKEDKNMVNEDVAEFLVKSADARMMDAKEGRLATKKGTTSAVRNYGKLMLKDQETLLKKIKVLAAKKNVTLPTGISDKKADGRDDLAKESGKDFDQKFIKMITVDHERDVKMFKKAIDLEDKEVKEFAQKYLPLIQSHLDKSNAIKDAMK
ncbi:hypothetical protein BH09BAC3_BH09BAC3_17640 [soil metagenome]